jgi:ketosteroid isomerase-like protein
MNDDRHDFEQFLKRREEVGRAYVGGDAAPLGEIVTRTSPATFFGPMGGFVQGADEVWTRYERDAASFAPGGDSNFEILAMEAGDRLAYWVGFQRATARMRGSDQEVPMSLRVTEVFRREGETWKLVHRHADMLASEEKGKKPQQP